MRASRFPTISILVASVEGVGGYPRSMFGGGGPWQVLCSGPTSTLDTFTPSVILIPSTYPPPPPPWDTHATLWTYSSLPLQDTHPSTMDIPSPLPWDTHPLLVTPGGHHWRQYSPPLPNRMTDTCENITFLQLRWLAVITL